MSQASPRIIIKRPIKAAAHHGGGWKIAYADFMTAMMAFFLVMWLLAISTPKQLAGIAEHFKMPLKVAMSGGDKSSLSTSMIPGGGADPVELKGEVKASDSDADDENRLSQLKKQLDEMIEANPELKLFRPQLLIDITPEGLRIQIVDSSNRPMFDRSSAVVVSYMRTILREIGPALNQQPNKITLSGHTDATLYPQGDKSYSNWELSADRANASRRELIAGGMEDTKVLRVMGVASSMHLNQDDPFAPVNRRISIVVLNHRAQAEIERANAANSAVKSGTKLSAAPSGMAGSAAPVLSTIQAGRPI
ncbi:chemotaxis protein MotB [Polaromonas sp. OV174]|uniref:flagellar motor protein MotB n=1 Tax=Polaromonas sp. OV174 TaxID=1855300 RepID=UPI0008EF4018|nr:flagellar motor protein MotB [Polaromonas sp. OV174]SFC70082.1 chemotaxis protein MotB [Polaromonas sp. OV174]